MITFITTTKNDKNGAKMLFSSLLLQTKLPDEIIVVDAESTDGTRDILKKYEANFKKKSIPFVIIRKNCNRARGRNIAIKKATHKIIVVSDAGCSLHRDWLKKITEPFDDKEVAVVSGYYKADAGTVFQKCLAAYTCVMPDKLTDDFLPSSRSIAFRKSSWQKVQGYPEHLDYCEDLVLARNMKNAGLNFFLEKKAIVTWPQKKTLLAAAKQFFSYARGDGQAFYIRPQTPFLFGRYLVGLIMLFAGFFYPSVWMYLCAAFVAYVFWAIIKNYRYVQNIQALYILPLLQFFSDVAVLSGMTLGVADRAHIAKGAFWQVFGKIGSSFFGLIAFSLLARTLSQTSMSSYTYIISISALLLTISDFGIDSLITRESSQKNNAVIPYYLGLRFFLAFFLIICSLIAITFFKVSILGIPFIIAGCGHLFFLLTNDFLSFLKGKKDFFRASIFQIGISFIMLCAIFLGILVRASTEKFIVFGAVASLVGFLVVKKNTSLSISFTPVKKILTLFWQTLPLGIAALISLAYLKLDVVFLGHYFPPDKFPDVGLYAIAYRPFELAIVIGGLYTQTLLPYLADKLHNNTFILQSFLKILCIAIALGLLLYIGAPFIISIIGGSDYGASIQALRILSGAAMSTILAGFAYTIILAKKRENYILISSLATLIVNIGMNYYLIPSHSYIGASWATLITQSTLCVSACIAAILAFRIKSASHG